MPYLEWLDAPYTECLANLPYRFADGDTVISKGGFCRSCGLSSRAPAAAVKEVHIGHHRP